MVQHDEISRLKVETVQFVARLLRVHDIFEDDKRRAFCVVRYALSDLSHGAEFAEEFEEFGCGDGVREVLDEEGTGWWSVEVA